MIITIDFARTLYPDDDPVHDFDHVLRVLALARRIGQAEGAAMDIVETAVLLHDIERAGDRETDHATDHALAAAEYARDILRQFDLPTGFIDAVAHAIAAHRFRNAVTPETLEAKVVFDADKLDAIGAIGVARAYAYSGMIRRKLWGEVPPDYAGDSPDHTAYHEFVYKLARIQDRMQTETGRALARERHVYMAEFFARLEQEIHGEL